MAKTPKNNLRAIGKPGFCARMLNKLIQQAANGEICQIMFVTGDKDGNLACDWDDSVSIENLALMKLKTDLEVHRAMLVDQEGEDAEF